MVAPVQMQPWDGRDPELSPLLEERFATVTKVTTINADAVTATRTSSSSLLWQRECAVLRIRLVRAQGKIPCSKSSCTCDDVRSKVPQFPLWNWRIPDKFKSPCFKAFPDYSQAV